MNYYTEIKTKLLNNEIYEKVKDYSKERHKVLTYFEIGRLLHEAGKHYGDSIIEKYADKLKIEINKKYNKRTLFRMKQFYVTFSNAKVSPAGTQLTFSQQFSLQPQASLATLFNQESMINKGVSTINSLNISSLATLLTWSHYIELLAIKDINEIQYYVNICIQQKLTRNTLRRKIKNKEYQRLSTETKTKLITKDNLDIKDFIPNPILIQNTSNIAVTNEKMLHGLIMENIASFMKELGDGYSFIDSEYKIKIDDRYNYIDLLLYNIKFKCYVVIELKVTEFKSDYIGQILKYMHYIDKNQKTINEENTIGIIICKKNNHFYMEYCSDPRIISREYELIK